MIKYSGHHCTACGNPSEECECIPDAKPSLAERIEALAHTWIASPRGMDEARAIAAELREIADKLNAWRDIQQEVK